MMRVRMFAAVAVLACCSGVGIAQMSGGTAAAAAGSRMSPAKAEDAMLSALEHEMMGVVNTMPADKFNFAPSTAIFASSQHVRYEGVRTFAQEATHVIQANYYFYSLVSGVKPDVDMGSFKSMTSKDQIVPALAASFAFAHKAVETITPENAFETIKGADGMNTRATLASFGVAHAFDHYGQMVEYLRMNGLVPPGSK